MSIKTRADLDQMKCSCCSVPGCENPVRLLPNCHRQAAIVVYYDGVLTLECADCKNPYGQIYVDFCCQLRLSEQQHVASEAKGEKGAIQIVPKCHEAATIPSYFDGVLTLFCSDCEEPFLTVCVGSGQPDKRPKEHGRGNPSLN